MENLPESNRGFHADGLRRRVIGCATVIEEMLPFIPADIPYEILDFGLHLNPGELKKILQEKIDQTSQNADVLMLGYGLCSLAVVNLRATTATLIIPRVDDCISVFLGSARAYKEQSSKEPGTYYLTKGWIEVGDSPFEEFPRLVEKYGEQKAARMIHLSLKNYTRLAFINTGNADLTRYQDYGRKNAAQFNLRYEEIDGTPELVKKMIFGPWDEDFVIIPPGQVVRYEDFTTHQKSYHETPAN
ncbi:MAG: DUF1638 domain-containing protein [Anaerolineaceae bacterium]|nr:DUF1638 domain-containing protein [Anaerolineaceae bacterium]